MQKKVKKRTKMFSTRLIKHPQYARFYSTHKNTLKLWIKHNGCPPTQVPVKGCTNMDDFADKVKQKINTHSPVSFFTSFDTKALDPGLSIKDLLKTDFLKSNSSQSPIYVKITPAAAEDSIAVKSIYIAETDDDGKFTGKYKQVKDMQQKDFMTIIKDSQGLVHISSPEYLVVNFESLKDGEKYHLYRVGQNFHGWQRHEAEAMEAETLLCMRTFLMEKLQASPINLPRLFFNVRGDILQEWDGILVSDDTLYLLEAKHSMTLEKVKITSQRVHDFPQMIKQSRQKVLEVNYNKIVGVVCGTLFPDDCRKEALRLGLMVVYPSGSRYAVNGKNEFDYAIER